ncbi:MAG: serine/threonine protein kinase, partial [Phycisphaerales bacterium]|nr:serine/threonine protein kinase [Phycisphaerales bacterium]
MSATDPAFPPTTPRTLFDRIAEHPRIEWDDLLAAELREGTDPAVIAQVRNLLGLVSVAREDVTSRSLEALRGQREVVERVVGPERAAPPLPVHSTVGPYRLEALLGEGGFAVVYKATQTEPVQRTVAVKVLKTGSHSGEMIRRFRQEQQSLAAMNHPNVAAVIDAGVSPEGWPYFVMEYVPGVPITAYCDGKRMTIRQRLELFIPVCEAVQHAHHKGIIHRDLKPSNVLVCEIEGRAGGVPKVIDFGVARVVDQSRGAGGATEGGAIVGTPEYMSPEQAAGEQMDVDTRSDVYSLGVMLYELLTGLLPFDPATLRSGGYGEVLRMIREVEPATPSERLGTTEEVQAGLIAGVRGSSRERLKGELGRELELIPLKAMRKARERRYDTAMVMADDLRRYLAGQTLVAGPETKRYRAAKFLARNRGAVAGAVVVAVALIVGLVVSL